MSCRPLALFFLAATALLSACGDGKDGNNEQAVAMRDLEVVDGTATDAMTDLDDVQTDGIALPPAPGAARAPSTADTSAPSSVAAHTEEAADTDAPQTRSAQCGDRAGPDDPVPEVAVYSTHKTEVKNY